MNLLIVDDEPLIQAGIKSMINWEEFGIHIAGTATNGALAYEMIEEFSPEIVIADIKMPVMNGLDLVQKCYKENRSLPVFIILTSYEEFQYVKKALTYGVIDYLVKLELTPDVLKESLTKAIDKVESMQQNTKDIFPPTNSIYLIKEQFYTRLLLNLFESEHQLESLANNLKLDFTHHFYSVSYVEITSNKLDTMSSEIQLNLYTNSLQLTEELTNKYIKSHVVSLDTKHFAIIFFLEEKDGPNYRELIKKALKQVSTMLFNYYNVTSLISTGSTVSSPIQIASSYQDAKQIIPHINAIHPIIFFEDIPLEEPLKNVFNMSLFKEDIRKAYAEFDSKALYDIFTSIVELFENQKTHYIQSLDAAGNILYLSLSLLNNGEQTVSQIFKDKNNSYRCLYELTSVEQILEWVKKLRDGLCDSFQTYNKDYKNHIVINVKKYINEHIEEKLTLNKVADVFNISSNYLSVLFSKYNDTGFTEYINQEKIEAAKKMMLDGDYKIYEISDVLGFESSFYFSRVFKKITGVPPRDYMNNNLTQ